MVQLALQDDALLEACSAYQEVWDTAEVKADEQKELHVSGAVCCLSFSDRVQVIENIIIYVTLAPYSNEQSDMLHKLYALQDMKKAPLHL
jgi:26S proteasome regulatory subunit N5